MAAVPKPSATIEFGRFTVVPQRRELLADGKPIELGGRAFDTLLALIDTCGRVLGKDELMRRVWPDQGVEEHNLHAQVSLLRKALGAERRRIRTVAGRGYLFTGEIRETAATVAAAPATRATNLPEAVSELIGREAELRDAMDLVTKHRLATLTGAGGIGKTRLGLEVARQLLPDFADGVWLAELAPLSDAELVADVVAAALGLDLAGGVASPDQIARALGPKQLLLVLDNCEHVIEPAARMAEALARANPKLCVMATSREPLRAEGEYLYRVPPLAVPAEEAQDPEDLLSHGAVQLFVARARAAESRFVPDARTATIIGAVCRRLDGIP